MNRGNVKSAALVQGGGMALEALRRLGTALDDIHLTASRQFG